MMKYGILASDSGMIIPESIHKTNLFCHSQHYTL